MKRIALFLITNLAVMLVLGVVLNVFGLHRWITPYGLDVPTLLVFSAVVGFTGSLISLFLSKPMAKWSTGAEVIDGSEGAEARWLVDSVHRLADRAGIGHPEVAIYEGAPNAFATGAFRDSALVAVSTGLLRSMRPDEVEAVLAHEVGHVANGDMVTLTLIQGVVNTFVVFLSRVVGFAIDNALSRGEDRERRGRGMGFYMAVMVCEILFGILASLIVAWFSRQREFRADAAAAKLVGSPEPMIHALARLGGVEPGALPSSVAAAGITSGGRFFQLFSTHPPIEERIARLRAR